MLKPDHMSLCELPGVTELYICVLDTGESLSPVLPGWWGQRPGPQISISTHPFIHKGFKNRQTKDKEAKLRFKFIDTTGWGDEGTNPGERGPQPRLLWAAGPPGGC